VLTEEDIAGVAETQILAAIARKVAETPKIWRMEGTGRTELKKSGREILPTLLKSTPYIMPSCRVGLR
jgi:hypothetical protein